ncbi:phosphomevalonate kinase [Topomyia yanbarensis]|uniref:phosphomevalonate kinase n=1 Tax=Topomyia yanbarensis TaxID=2498891 RepID=UPI00273BE1ED|nr:phosphomevalonate kinase [Topomyia yanbarensis]
MTSTSPSNPQIVLLFSGKRKSGKDFITERLLQRLTHERAQIIRISEPIKRSWANKLGLDLRELLSDAPYKEKFRKEMIEWSDQRRAEDYGIFCREALIAANREICIVSDVRRKSDIRYFKEVFGSKVKTVRIEANEQTRLERGWLFQKGVDDVQSECDLDDMVDWDLLTSNDCGADVESILDQICLLL